MNVVRRWSVVIAMLAATSNGDAQSPDSECRQQEVESHVRQQFAVYGPLSTGREYFGFVYRHDGVIASAVTRGNACASSGQCVVDSSEAFRSMPRSATVLGEWHTHPHGGSPSLSRDDVLGAYGNRHIGCYSAFYSTPSGDIYAWDPKRISVPVAMASRARVGNYFQAAAVEAGISDQSAQRRDESAGGERLGEHGRCERLRGFALTGCDQERCLKRSGSRVSAIRP